MGLAIENIENEYFNSLKNLDVQNPRLMVLFSGPPGSGKSVLAKSIEKEFGAIRLENDELRRQIHALYPNLPLSEKSRITLESMSKCRDKLLAKASNGLWVIDASIDRQSKTVFDFAKVNNFQTLVIALSLPEDVHRKRIIKRGGHPFASLSVILEHMTQRRAEQDLFLHDHNPDLVVGPSTPIGDVIKLVRGKLTSL